ncbi:MAG: type II secretion system F family protein [Patescibacteria group bacterium UBA2103]
MKKFSYKAQRADGSEYSGVVEGETRADVYAQVGAEGGTVLSIKEQGAGLLNKLRSFLGAVKMEEKIVLTRTLAAMLKAGLSVSRALSVLERQSKNPLLKQVLQEIGNDVSKGMGLHEAMAKHPKIFSKLFVSMVKAGEESGTLHEALLVIGKQMERSHTLVKKVKSAMIYPSIILIAIFIITILMLLFVVPTLTSTFEELGVELPAATQAIVSSSDFLQNNFLLVLAAFIAFAAAVYYALKSERGSKIFGAVTLRLPVVGAIVKETYTARTARTLSSLLASGVEMLHALEISEEVIGHPSYRKIFKESHEHVKKGEALSKSFMDHLELYPVLMGDMIAVGEETGAVSDMLLEVAEFYETEVEQKTKDLSTIVEPLLMILIAGVVGVFALAMIAPIYSITDSI